MDVARARLATRLAFLAAGYAGILLGPAGVGAVAKVIGLPAAFWGLAGHMALVPIFAHIATGRK